MTDYVHGYSDCEEVRLHDQADRLAVLLHQGTVYPAGCRVLEAGCGVGAQTIHLAANSPQADFTCVDISEASLAAAEMAVAYRGLTNARFQQADIFNLPFDESTFDEAFVCFVLEHLADPARALAGVRRVLRPGGGLTVIEGDHGSTFFHPPSPAAWRTIQCLVDLQAAAGGNANIGRSLFPLLQSAGFRDVQVAPKTVYADASRPDWVDGFTRKTFIAMVEGVEKQAVSAGMIDQNAWNQGIADLKRTAEADGTFIYTFFKATGQK